MKQSKDKNGYNGLVAAMITTCRAPGEVDPEAYGRLCRTMVDNGCDGLFVVGSTGEMPLLDGEDRRKLIASARDAVGGEATIYAGVSGLGRGQTVRLTQMAADAGAEVAVVMVPFMLKFNQAEIEAYITAIADDSPLPLGLYHHQRMPTVFEVDTVARLARHPNVAVMKDTSGDMQRLQALRQGIKDHGVTLLQGREPYVLPSLQAEADGCINALAVIVPDWFRALFDAHAAGRGGEASRWQERITRLAQIFRLEEAGTSFSAWCYTLRWIAMQRGFLENPAGMMPGFEPPRGFEDSIRTVMEECGLAQIIHENG